MISKLSASTRSLGDIEASKLSLDYATTFVQERKRSLPSPEGRLPPPPLSIPKREEVVPSMPGHVYSPFQNRHSMSATQAGRPIAMTAIESPVTLRDLASVFDDSIHSIHALGNAFRDDGKFAEEISRAKESFESRFTEFQSVVGEYLINPKSDDQNMERIVSTAMEVHSIKEVKRFLAALYTALWKADSKFRSYFLRNNLNPLTATFKRPKVEKFIANATENLNSAMISLSLALAEHSAISAQEANGNVSKIAIATAAVDWEDLATNDAQAVYMQGEKYFLGFGVPKSYELASKRYLMAAKLGIAGASNMLGFLYEHGLGVEKSLGTAFGHYNDAHKLNHPEGHYNLGRLYESGVGVAADARLAYHLYHLAADLDVAESMYDLGRMNENGIGKRKNLEKAFQWYKSAANHGSAKGQNALGHCYYRGIGVAQDSFQAMEAFKASALSGYPPAFNNLGIAYEEGNGVAKSLTTAKHYYKLAADGKNPSGLNNYGYVCLLEEDYWTAVGYFQAARSLKNADAAYNLATLYENGCVDTFGTIVDSNLDIAVRYYREAATNPSSGTYSGGYVKAQIQLASLLVAEFPCDESFQEAEVLLLAAIGEGPQNQNVSKGDHTLKISPIIADAKNMLGELYEMGVCDLTNREPNYERAFELYREAIKQGSGRAAFNLAVHYESGKFLQADMGMAIGLLTEASRRGNTDASERLEELQAAGCLVEA